jgi:hypothetical protein
MKIIRVFPRSTNATPDDADVRINAVPSLFDDADEVHISVTFTWDLARADYLARAWRPVAPVRIGGPAYNERGGDFVPGMYMRKGYVITSRGCPNRCLHGDTPVLTTDGVFYIRDLVGKNVHVLTRSADGRLIFAKTSQIKQTGTDRRMVIKR